MEEKEKVIVMTVNEDGTAQQESKWRTKARELGSWAKRTVTNAWGWCCDNKADLIVLVPLGLATLKGVRNMAPKKSVTQIERERVDRNYYDPTTGINWTLKRPLRTWEKEELVRRRRNGEYTESILREMRVLDR